MQIALGTIFYAHTAYEYICILSTRIYFCMSSDSGWQNVHSFERYREVFVPLHLQNMRTVLMEDWQWPRVSVLSRIEHSH